MIYIVSGMPRSGTTCMMRALEAGGMTVASSPERDQLAASCADEYYQPNPDNKLYEIPMSEYGNIDFPLPYQGKLIKVILWGLDGLAVNSKGYRVIIMRRDPEEIRQSYEAFFNQPFRHPWLSDYDKWIDRTADLLLNRRDVVNCNVVHYRTLISRPEMTLATFAEDGWDINLPKAVATINPSLYRFRRERLTVGI